MNKLRVEQQHLRECLRQVRTTRPTTKVGQHEMGVRLLLSSQPTKQKNLRILRENLTAKAGDKPNQMLKVPIRKPER
jgi:hypothetical protein